MQITMMKISDVHPYDRNPRNNDAAVDAVAKSIKEFGWRAPIVVDKDMVIVAGHTRLKAAIKLGLTEVPVHVASDLTPEQIQAFRIADNKTGEIAEWNYDLLPLELKELQGAGFEMDLLGFDTSELEKLLSDVNDEVAEGETEADAIPDVPEEAASRPGEIYQLGNHRLMCGDSTSVEDTAKLMAGEKAVLYLTDPPYNVALEGSTGLTIKNDNMPTDEFRKFLDSAFGAAATVLNEGCSFYIFHSDSESANFRLAAAQAGLEVHETLYWVKNALVLGRFDYHYITESCLYGWTPGAAHRWFSDRCQTNALHFDKPKCNDVHPCLAPETLVMTSAGYRPIGEIQSGDQVLGNDGCFHAVKSVSNHPYLEKIVEIAVTGTNYKDLATHNHPYLVARKEVGGDYAIAWLDAENIRENDFLMTPQLAYGNLANVTELDAWCYGLWAAQGSLQKSGHGGNGYPVFSLDARKKGLAEKVKLWGKNAKVSVYPNHGNGIKVMIFDKDKGQQCQEICGKYALLKTLSSQVFNWNRELRAAFFEGYMAGDGCRISTRQHRHSKSVSRMLASQMKYLAESLGYKVDFYHNFPSKKHPNIRGRRLRWLKEYYSNDYHEARRTFEQREFEWNGRKYWLRRVKSVRKIQYNGDVINLNVDGGHTFQTACGMTHNSMKPVEMLVYLVKNSSAREDVVLDNFGGSGSTLIACEQTGRKCRMMELDPKYCDVIRRRWAEFKHGEGCDWQELTPAITNNQEENTENV